MLYAAEAYDDLDLDINAINSISTELRDGVLSCNTHTAITNDSLGKIDDIEAREASLKEEMQHFTLMHETENLVIKIMQDYMAERYSTAINDLSIAIDVGSRLIEGCPPLHLSVRNNYASIVATKSGRTVPVNNIEGGGQRSSISFFIRRTVLAHTKFMPLMWLDESFATMSSETTRAFSYLSNQAAEHMQIFIIEQKDEIFDAGAAAKFKFTKVGDTTTVERVL